MQSILLTLTLMVTTLGVSSAMAAEMVKDPSTGEMVEAPRYGGTLTYATRGLAWNWDPYYGWTDPLNSRASWRSWLSATGESPETNGT